jgi:hypothetical protein
MYRSLFKSVGYRVISATTNTWAAKLTAVTLLASAACQNSTAQFEGVTSRRYVGSVSAADIATTYNMLSKDPDSAKVVAAWRQNSWADLEESYFAQDMSTSEMTGSVAGHEVSNSGIEARQAKAVFARAKKLPSPDQLMAELGIDRDAITQEMIEDSAALLTEIGTLNPSELEKYSSEDLAAINRATLILQEAVGLAATDEQQQVKGANLFGLLLAPFVPLLGLANAVVSVVHHKVHTFGAIAGSIVQSKICGLRSIIGIRHERLCQSPG